MELTYIYIICMIALCNADENTQVRKPGTFSQDLQDYVRRLTEQQSQTTQDLQDGLSPRFNLPRLHHRVESSSGQDFPPNFPQLRPREANGQLENGSPLSLLNFPFQSTMGGEVIDPGARSYTSSSVSVKRPQAGVNVESRASAFASLKDVSEEENLEEKLGSSLKASTKMAEKPSESKEDSLNTVEDIAVTKGEPYALKHQQLDTVQIKSEDSFSDVYFVAIVAGCCAVGIFGVISAGICFYKLQKSRKAAADVDYPAYGVTGPNKDISSPNGDRKLAQSAQMYHYQHQKQQMIAVEKAGSTKNTSASDVDSEEENEEGDYTVYECPGLAPTGEMEVKNPLFHDDSTPVSPPVLPSKPDSNQNN